MKITCLTILFFITICNASAQYQYDNVKYKTVYAEDICKTIEANPGYLLLDVRSKGEFHDTSSNVTLNIGHFNNAINIDVRDLGKRINDLKSYVNKPIFVYCSHSQRSRRASTMLADSGFTKVFNINGGMTAFRLNDAVSVCPGLYIQSQLPFTYISPYKLARDFTKENFYILDIRKDSAFKGISLNIHSNTLGKFRNAVNIPYEVLEQNPGLAPKGKKILLIDETGNESVKAALFLHKKGLQNIYVLFNGMEMWDAEMPENDRPYWSANTPIHMINPYEFHTLMNSQTKPLILDIRTKEEFDNKAREYWKNAGRIKNAVNIPYKELKEAPFKATPNTPIIIYSFSTDDEAFAAAQQLLSKGYKNVYVLMGGIFNMRWRAANFKGREYLDQWVVNVPVVK